MKTKDNNSYVPIVGRNWRIIDYEAKDSCPTIDGKTVTMV